MILCVLKSKFHVFWFVVLWWLLVVLLAVLLSIVSYIILLVVWLFIYSYYFCQLFEILIVLTFPNGLRLGFGLRINPMKLMKW